MSRLFENTSRGIANIEVQNEDEARILYVEVYLADAMLNNFKIS